MRRARTPDASSKRNLRLTRQRLHKTLAGDMLFVYLVE